MKTSRLFAKLDADKWKQNEYKNTGITFDNIFEHDLFLYHKLGGLLIGRWPYSTEFSRHVPTIILPAASIFIFPCQINYYYARYLEKNYDDILINLFWLITHFLVIALWINYIINKKRTKQIHDIIKRDWSLINSYKERETFITYTVLGYRLMQLLNLYIVVVGAVNFMIPWIGLYEFKQSGKEKKLFAYFLVKFKFIFLEESYTFKYFICSYSIYCFAFPGFFGHLNFTVTSLITMFFYAFIKLDLLNFWLEGISDNKDSKNTYKKIKFFARQHIDFLHTIQLIVKWNRLFLLSGSIIILSCLVCLLYYMTLKHDDFNHSLFIVGLIVYCLSSEYLICFAGEVLTKKADKLAVSCYGCKWETLSPCAKSSILLIQQKSNMSINFAVHGLVSLKHVTFVQIMKAAFSYVTFLRQFRQSKN